MNKYAVSLLSAVLMSSCLIDNPLHCISPDKACDEEKNMYCSMDSGRCEVVPLTIKNIEPTIVRQSDTSVSIKGTGFYEINSISANGISVLDAVKTMTRTQVDLDLPSILARILANATSPAKCGPIIVEMSRKDGMKVAVNELVGRGFSRWIYQSAAQPAITNVADFSFGSFDKKVFDYIYFDKAQNVSALVSGTRQDTQVLSADILSSKLTFLNSNLVLKGKKIFTLHNRSILSIGTLPGLDSEKNSAEICGSNLALLDQKPVGNTLIGNLFLSCINGTGLALGIKSFDLVKRSTVGSLGSYQLSKVVRSTSFAPSDSDCGVALVSAGDAFAPTGIVALCKNSATESLQETPLMGTNESVASVNSRNAGTFSTVTRHYVLNNNNGILQMQVFDAQKLLSKSSIVPFIVSPIDFNPKDIGSFSGSGAKIEINDLNCDEIPDVIIKTDRRIVAYLGISDTTWESTPKVLFEMPSTAPGITINKAALWIPDYSMPQALGVLGILDSTGNLALYQQQ